MSDNKPNQPEPECDLMLEKLLAEDQEMLYEMLDHIQATIDARVARLVANAMSTRK